ncbi:dihydrofolate reductase family protein [Nocardioides palaemonis]|uniref:dihydrofolate reductase family protein n=1 Tax=Nocardioides palaemonis TaxID=2829810 RepID=UPI0027DAE13E|nr:dihydrofolate reductase family protein [Nocardioides palaemonis]
MRRRLGDVATIVDAGPEVDVVRLCGDLLDRGVRRLMVEGGGQVHTRFLTASAADELHLVVAPFFVGPRERRGRGCTGVLVPTDICRTAPLRA